MSDLISRSALIEVLKEYSNNDWNKSLCAMFSDCVDTCIDYVENAPTAYDVEKVVEEVKQVNNICNECKHKNCEKCTIHKICDIIRAGGKE